MTIQDLVNELIKYDASTTVLVNGGIYGLTEKLCINTRDVAWNYNGIRPSLGGPHEMLDTIIDQEKVGDTKKCLLILQGAP